MGLGMNSLVPMHESLGTRLSAMRMAAVSGRSRGGSMGSTQTCLTQILSASKVQSEVTPLILRVSNTTTEFSSQAVSPREPRNGASLAVGPTFAVSPQDYTSPVQKSKILDPPPAGIHNLAYYCILTDTPHSCYMTGVWRAGITLHTLAYYCILL